MQLSMARPHSSSPWCGMCNSHETLSIFGIPLTSHIFASAYLIIPKTMESIIDNCQLSEKQHRLERNYGPQSRAQHQTLRGRKHIYKNIYRPCNGLFGQYKRVYTTCRPNTLKCLSTQYRTEVEKSPFSIFFIKPVEKGV